MKKTIGIIIDYDFEQSQEAMLGISLKARQLGYNVVSGYNLSVINESTVDGLVFIRLNDQDKIKVLQLRKINFPTVILNSRFPGVSSVMPDNVGGINQLVSLLKKEGHERIAFIRGVKAKPNAEERFQAFKDALLANEMHYDPALVIRGGNSLQTPKKKLKQLLSSRSDFSAIVASNDISAKAAIHAINQIGLRVPEDMVVTGFNGFHFGQTNVHEGITTIRISVHHMGSLAMDLMHEQLTATPKKEQEITVSGKLILDNSTHKNLSPLSYEPLIGSEQDALINHLLSYGNKLDNEEVHLLYHEFTEEIEKGATSLISIQNLFLKGIELGLDSHYFHFLLVNLGNRFSCWDSQHESFPTLSQITHTLDELINSEFSFFNRYQQDLIERWESISNPLEDNQAELNCTEHVVTVLDKMLEKLGVRFFQLILFPTPLHQLNDSVLEASVWKRNETQSLSLDIQDIQLESIDLKSWIPVKLEQNHASVSIMDLRVPEGRLGFLLVDIDSEHCGIFNRLSGVLSGKLQSARLYESLKKQNEKIKTWARELEVQTKVAVQAKKQEEGSRKLAERANDAKNELIANVSHEIRTPLDSIIGTAELALDQDMNSEIRTRFELVRESGTSMLKVIDNLLDISRVLPGNLHAEHNNSNEKYYPVSHNYEFKSNIEQLNPEPSRVSKKSINHNDDTPIETVVGKPKGKGYEILLVEDNPINRIVATEILKKENHTITTANNGQEALDLWSEKTFDLLIMDISMPKIDGWEATRIIREKEKLTGKHTVIMAMTAHAMKGDERRCLQAGMDAYISKPVNRVKFVGLVEKLCGNQTISLPNS